jgi:hypothetical protein
MGESILIADVNGAKIKTKQSQLGQPAVVQLFATDHHGREEFFQWSPQEARAVAAVLNLAADVADTAP